MSKIEAGIYKGRGVEGSAQRGHARTGTEQVGVSLDIPALGRQLTAYLAFTPAAEPYSVTRLRALGWDGSSDPTFPGISRNEVDVQIKYEMYGGAEQMKVEILTGGGKMSSPMDAQEARSFMARISKIAQQQQAAAPTTNATPGKFSL